MYFGKFALLCYIFAAATFAVGYILFAGMGWELFGDSDSQAALNTIAGRHDQAINATETNPAFIFGDYAAAAQAIGVILFNVPTGGLIADLWDSVGGILVGGTLSEPVYMLIRILVTFSSVCLVINIISGRDL